MRKIKYENPFSLGELSNLGLAREENDLDYLKEWSYLAVKWYEKEKAHYLRLFDTTAREGNA